jgi:hypothetical protein
MRPETLLAYLRAASFQPFRIVLNSGRTYNVQYPEMVRVGRDSLVYYSADSPEAPYERLETVGLLLVERLEHVETFPLVSPSATG